MARGDELKGFGTCPFCPEEVVVRRMKDNSIAVACRRCEYVLLFNARTDIAKRRWNRRMSMIHGSVSGYIAGCRCEKCKSASKEYVSEANVRQRERQRAWRSKALDELKSNPDDRRHGKTGYGYGCRCERCKSGKRAAGKRSQRRKDMEI